jgi:HAE1 family hydrophobic/amphiphilic exporter-1
MTIRSAPRWGSLVCVRPVARWWPSIISSRRVLEVGPSKRMREAIVFAFGLALVAIYIFWPLNSIHSSVPSPSCYPRRAAPRRAAPLCFIGAFAALWISGVSLDIMGQIAFLMLMGIVMKNGILLVDYTNQ